MRINSEELKACELDQFVGRHVTVIIRASQRPLDDPEEFHNYFTGHVVQMNHLGLWLEGGAGHRSFVFWHAVQAVLEESPPVDAESPEVRNRLARAEQAKEEAEAEARVPPWMKLAAQQSQAMAAAQEEPQPEELVQLSFDKLRARAEGKGPAA